MTFLIIVSLIIQGCGGGSSGTGSGRGNIKGEVTVKGIPLVGAIMSIEEEGITNTTDSNGNYAFYDIPCGEKTLNVIYKGEVIGSYTVEIIAGETKEFNINFSNLDGVVEIPSMNIASLQKNRGKLGLILLYWFPELTPYGFSPASQAQVTILETDRSTQTDPLGRFHFDYVQTGRLHLKVDLQDGSSLFQDVMVGEKNNISDIVSVELFPEDVTLLEGEIQQFIPVVENKWGETIIPADIQWSLTNPDIGLIIEDGVFLAINPGKGKIIAEYGGQQARAVIEVSGSWGNISGKALFIPSNVPAKGVLIRIKGIRLFSITNEKGEFFLENVPANTPLEIEAFLNLKKIASTTVFIYPKTTLRLNLYIRQDFWWSMEAKFN